jgi:PKD repeat protein
VYVSARATDADSYVSRLTLDWGDGSAATNFDYPLSACQAAPSSQAADANHRYATAGTYVVRLIVTSVRCDGSDAQTESSETTVIYPSSPPSG